MPTQRILYLLQLYFNNTITKKQKEEISRRIIQSKNKEELIGLLQEVWMNYVPDTRMPEDVSDKILKELFSKEEPEEYVETATPVINISSKTRWWKVAAAAASIIMLIAGTYVWFSPFNDASVAKMLPQQLKIINDAVPGGQRAVLTLADGTQIVLDSASNGMLARQGNAQVIKLSNGEISYKTDGAFSGEALYNTMSTPVGGVYQLTLPDASKVLLNATSSIRYPAEFAGKERRVEVSGEVYFEIAKDAEKPFIVKVNNTEIKVLGTHFNVNAYENEGLMKTTLLEGAINISHGKNNSLLKPGQQAQLSETGSIKMIDADIEEAVAWKDGNFQFNSTGLDAVLRQAARWYNLEVVYMGSIPPDKFTGKISRSVNLSQLLKWMEWSGVHFKLEGNKLIVMPP